MKEIQLFLLILFSIKQTTAHQDVCPPWFIPDNKSSTGCSCVRAYGAVECSLADCSSSESPLLHLGFCMTYNNATKTTEYGPCPYIAQYKMITSVDYVLCIQLPSNVSLLNEFMCGPLNREGELCGWCKDGYGIALYSYTQECSKCWGHGSGWVLYWTLELLPITVLYVLVVIFHIRATSSPLSALVFMSQIVVYTIWLNVPLHMYIENKVEGFTYTALQVMLVLCGIWSGLLSFCYSTILCKQQYQSCSCTCTWVSSSILSHLSHYNHLCMYKTPWQQLQTNCLDMEAISPIFCSFYEKLGLQGTNNQHFYDISASLFFQNFICIIHFVIHLSCPV